MKSRHTSALSRAKEALSCVSGGAVGVLSDTRTLRGGVQGQAKALTGLRLAVPKLPNHGCQTDHFALKSKMVSPSVARNCQSPELFRPIFSQVQKNCPVYPLTKKVSSVHRKDIL